MVGAGDASHPDGYPWVGSYSDRKMYRLNPKTGAVINGHNLDIEPFVRCWLVTMMVSTGSAVLQPITHAVRVSEGACSTDDALCVVMWTMRMALVRTGQVGYLVGLSICTWV